MLRCLHSTTGTNRRPGAHRSKCLQHYAPFRASFSLAAIACRRTTLAMNAPITPRPSTSRIAGRRTAHTRGGKYSWMAASSGKNGCLGQTPRDVDIPTYRHQSPERIVREHKAGNEQEGTANDAVRERLGKWISRSPQLRTYHRVCRVKPSGCAVNGHRGTDAALVCTWLRPSTRLHTPSVTRTRGRT